MIGPGGNWGVCQCLRVGDVHFLGGYSCSSRARNEAGNSETWIWLVYDAKRENIIMLIEPAILLKYNSTRTPLFQASTTRASGYSISLGSTCLCLRGPFPAHSTQFVSKGQGHRSAVSHDDDDGNGDEDKRLEPQQTQRRNYSDEDGD